LLSWLSVLALVWTLTPPCPASARDFVRSRRLPGRLVVRARAGLEARVLQDVLARHGARRIDAVDALAVTMIEAPEKDLAAIEAALRRSGVFKSVERDYQVEIAEEPNDFYYAAQWALPRIGAPAAWDVSSGAGVVVAVLDTGIDALHPDLLGQTLPGRDFVNDDDDPADDHGHGTRMSGIIAALRNNVVGIAGIAPAASILPVKVLNDGGTGAYSDVAAGIVYAVDQGVRVLNLSLTGPVQSDVLQDAIDYATARDAVVVAASGNWGSDEPAYPAAATGAVAVSAIDAHDAHPIFSNYGAWISFAAPGVDIVTTSPFGGYSSSSGTSPAAAVGSAVFALLLAAEPALSRSEAIARVESETVDVGSQGWDPYYGWGRVDALSAVAPGGPTAPPPDQAAPEVTLLSPAKGSLLWGMMPVDVVASDDVAVARVELFIDNRWYATATSAPYQFVVDTTQLEPGQHKLRAYAYDTSEKDGHTKSRRISVTPGTGLLVKHAIARASSVSISGDFALPAGAVFDPDTDDLVITLTSADGTVLSGVAPAGMLAESHTGKTRGTIVPAVPSLGSMRVSTKRSGDQPVYRLRIKAKDLSNMSGLDTVMNLAVQVGGAQLSQSLTFRTKGGTLIYP